MLETIHQNILDIESGIICHFCNTEGVMGAGLALQVKQRYPEAFEVYQRSSKELGTITLVDVEPYKYVCNMVTQDLKGRGIQYLAVLQCLAKLKERIPVSPDWNTPVFFPEFVGCGLGKGNPDAIQAMIEFFLPNSVLVRY
jgi:hypothetical protein